MVTAGGKYKSRHKRWFILKEKVLYYFRQPTVSLLSNWCVHNCYCTATMGLYHWTSLLKLASEINKLHAYTASLSTRVGIGLCIRVCCVCVCVCVSVTFLNKLRANHVTSSQSDRSKCVTWRTLNRVEHTLSCFKFLRAHFAVRRRQDSSDSRAQEREGHAA